MILIGTGIAVAIVTGLVLADPATGEALSIATGLIAGTVGVLAAVRSRGALRAGWALLSALPILYAAGDTIWLVHADATGSPPILSVADAMYLLALPPAATGLLVYPVLRGVTGHRVPLALDAVVVMLSIATISVVVALAEVMATADSWSGGMILAVYPLTDGFLVALCIVLLLRSSGRPRLDVVLLGLTFVTYLMADIGYALEMIRGSSYDNVWLITGFAVAPVLMTAAALVTLLTPTRRQPHRRHLTGISAPSIPVLVALVALAWAVLDAPSDRIATTLVLTLLAALGLRQLAQTAAGHDLRAQLELRVSQRDQEVEDLAAQYRLLETMKYDFVTSVSHELRTPLTAIRGSLELLEDDAATHLQPGTRHLVAVATRGSERLSRLVDDLLDLERLERDGYALATTPTDVRRLATEAAASLSPIAHEHGVQVVVGPDSADAQCDPDRVVQVLVNLLGNALKFAPPGSEVGIDVERHHDEIRVSVSDAGCGIPETQLDAVFDRFHQVAPQADSRRVGSGLGLAISKRIVHAHGGRIWAESTEGAGSTFRFTLPATG